MVLVFLILTLFSLQIDAASLHWKPKCYVDQFKGVCVDVKECPFAQARSNGDLPLAELARNFNQHTSACLYMGRSKFCCDETTTNPPTLRTTTNTPRTVATTTVAEVTTELTVIEDLPEVPTLTEPVTPSVSLEVVTEYTTLPEDTSEIPSYSTAALKNLILDPFIPPPLPQPNRLIEPRVERPTIAQETTSEIPLNPISAPVTLGLNPFLPPLEPEVSTPSKMEITPQTTVAFRKKSSPEIPLRRNPVIPRLFLEPLVPPPLPQPTRRVVTKPTTETTKIIEQEARTQNPSTTRSAPVTLNLDPFLPPLVTSIENRPKAPLRKTPVLPRLALDPFIPPPIPIETGAATAVEVEQDSISTHPNFEMFNKLKCGLIAAVRISGGEDAELLEFPWAARVGYKSPLDRQGQTVYGCGGSLISESLVLTTAHCVSFLPSNRILDHVRLGEYNIDEEEDCDYEDLENTICADPVQDIKIASAVYHHEYNRSLLSNDIGIIKLAEKAKMKQNNIRPICLPLTDELKEIPKNLLVTGWGKTETQSESRVLQKAKVPLFDHFDCYQLFKNSNKLHRRFTLTDHQFCAGGEGKTDACKGDSGNAIQSAGLFNGKPRMVQFGIVSYGIQSCGVEESFPGIYVDVSKYVPWILDNAVN